MLAGSSTVVLLVSVSAGNDNFSAMKTQPEPACRGKRREEGQQSSLEANSPGEDLNSASESTVQSMGCGNRAPDDREMDLGDWCSES